jgi:hydrogenase nickel incorporation protein HypA/HybF
MHEMGIAIEIVKITIDSIPTELKNPTVKRIHLEIGKLAAVVPTSLQFCFEVVTKDTILEGAKLHIEEIPVWAKCKNCGYFWMATEPIFMCKKCDSGAVEIVSGQELDITGIEVDDNGDDSSDYLF